MSLCHARDQSRLAWVHSTAAAAAVAVKSFQTVIANLHPRTIFVHPSNKAMRWHDSTREGIRTWSVLHCSIYAWNLTPNRHIPWSHSFRVLWRIDSRERLHHIVHTLHRNCYLHHSMDELRQIEISSKLSLGMQTTRFSSSSKPNVIYYGGVNYCWWSVLFFWNHHLQCWPIYRCCCCCCCYSR